MGSCCPSRVSHTSARSKAAAPPGTKAMAPESDQAAWVAPLAFTKASWMPGCTGTGPPLTISRSSSNGIAKRVASRTYARWPVGSTRASVPPLTSAVRRPVASSWTTTTASSQGCAPVRIENNTARPPAMSWGPCASSVLLSSTPTRSFAVPPLAGTSTMPRGEAWPTRMRSPIQEPPNGLPTAASVTGVPPVIGTFFSSGSE